MKKFLLILIPLAALAVFFLLQQKQPSSKISLPTPTVENERVNLTASFEVYTPGVKRIFTDPKYHNQSEDVYITAEDPGTIYVKKRGITWDDFFKTLPMKLTKECLTTGTGQQFCNGQGGSLKFFTNDQENPNALDEEIKEGDQLTVRFE